MGRSGRGKHPEASSDEQIMQGVLQDKDLIKKSMNDDYIGYNSKLPCQAQLENLDTFNHLVLKYQDLLYNHAFTLMGVRQSAEDATQDGILKAFRKIESFRGGSFRCWLLKIVTNTCYDELRRLKRFSTTPLYPENENDDELDEPFWLVDPHISVAAMIEEKERSMTLRHYLNELPEYYRSVINLIDIYELDYSETASILKIPLGTLKSRLLRARLQMKRMLQNDLEPSLGFVVLDPQPI